MAIGWITVLKLVPWGEVIKNAPAVADSAKKLWDTVGGKPAPTPAAGAAGTVVVEGETGADQPAALRARLADAELAIGTLHEQMQASSTLIKALAEQNTELIRRVEIQRVRQGWLAVLLVAVGVLAAYALSVALAR